MLVSSQTHSRHQVRITVPEDHPFGTIVEVDGRQVETAQRVTVDIPVEGVPHVTIVHGCWDLEVAGVATVDHKCGAPYVPAPSDTGYLGTVRTVLREFASRVLLAGDVTGMQRELVLDELDAGIDRMAEDTARAVLAGAANVMLTPGFALDDGSDDPPERETDFLYIDGVTVRNLDLDPGLHAVIRLPQGVA